MKHLFLTFVGLLTFLSVSAVDTTIEKIYENPSQYDGELVTVPGLVTQFVEAEENSTAHYLLKGDFGRHIRVVTAEKEPETYKKYKVTGIVYINQELNSPFISETSRIEIGAIKDSVKSENEKGLDFAQFLLIAIAIAAVIAVIMIFVKGVGKQSSGASPEVGTTAPLAPMKDFQTIKINKVTEDAKTIKYIPGELKIIGGKDKGKVFKIGGYPTDEGNVVSIGRGDVHGERRYAHIKLMDQTVSRQQALIIQKGKKLLVKNMSKTNFTVVDGVELKTDETAEIKPGSTIKTGEVEFQYILNK